MRVLDIDMDYFMEYPAYFVSTNDSSRLSQEVYGEFVWSETMVRQFLENNLGLSKENKVKGRIVSNHNEALLFWKELYRKKELDIPFEVIHVDSHADLGLGFNSWEYIQKKLLSYPVIERPFHNRYVDACGKENEEGIGDYLLFAIAYRWISKLTYCANPYGDKNDYLWNTMKNFEENFIFDAPTYNIVQLLYNPNMDMPKYNDSKEIKQKYIDGSCKEPEVPFLIIPTVEGVMYDGNFEFAVLSQSPNYTPANADYIMDIFRDYIIEI